MSRPASDWSCWIQMVHVPVSRRILQWQLVTDMANPFLDNLTRGTPTLRERSLPNSCICLSFSFSSGNCRKYYPVQLPNSNKFHILWIFSRIWPLMVPSNFLVIYKLLPVFFWQAVALRLRLRHGRGTECLIGAESGKSSVWGSVVFPSAKSQS